jgi:hypothetical protein
MNTIVVPEVITLGFQPGHLGIDLIGIRVGITHKKIGVITFICGERFVHGEILTPIG